MKICFISTMDGCPWGGSEELWAATARAALEAGHRVSVVVFRWPETPRSIADLRARGAEIFHRSRRQDWRATRIFEQLVHPFPRLVLWKPDVLCLSQGSTFCVAHRLELIRFLHLCRAPYVLVCQHNRDSQVLREETRHRALGLVRRAHRVLFVSEQNRRSAERQLATDLPNSLVVHNPVNLRERDVVPWPAHEPPRLACVARLDALCKGQDILLEVLGRAAWKARRWTLRLYGAGPDRQYLMDLARHLKIDDRTEFLGHVSDIRSVWAENHLLLLPSRSEGTPLALVEAMICGRPSVVTDVGGNAEWVEEPRNGFVAEAPTARCFGAALERAWALRASWEPMGLLARDAAIRQWNPRPAETVLSILTDAVRSSSPEPIGALHPVRPGGSSESSIGQHVL